MFDVVGQTVGGNSAKRSQPAAINYIITLTFPVLIFLSSLVCLSGASMTKRNWEGESLFSPLLSHPTPTLISLSNSFFKDGIISSSINKVDGSRYEGVFLGYAHYATGTSRISFDVTQKKSLFVCNS